MHGWRSQVFDLLVVLSTLFGQSDGKSEEQCITVDAFALKSAKANAWLNIYLVQVREDAGFVWHISMPLFLTILVWCSSLKHHIICANILPPQKKTNSYSSCKTMYFYAKKIFLRAIIIWAKLREKIFSFGPDWPPLNSRHYTICALIEKCSYVI
jgi:hypothetical protein